MAAKRIYRVWTFISDSSSGPKGPHTLTLWDLGNEVWELQNDSDSNEIRHFEVISRKQIYDQEQVSMEEVVSLLPECPIPVEAIRHIIGSEWQITEKEEEHIEQLPSPLEKKNPPPLKRQAPSQTSKELEARQQPLLLSQQRNQLQSSQGQQQTRQQQPLPLQQPQLHPQHSQSSHPLNSEDVLPKHQEEQPPLTQKRSSKKTRKTEETYSESCSSTTPENPNQLWSSLSQWIPPTALYQPSLHHQAVLDMTDKTVHIHVSPKRTFHPQRHSKHRQDPCGSKVPYGPKVPCGPKVPYGSKGSSALRGPLFL